MKSVPHNINCLFDFQPSDARQRFAKRAEEVH